jgi:hypothetical protein
MDTRSGLPNNERFKLPAVPDEGADYMEANYDPNPYVGIGSNFPGDGAWVITWAKVPTENTWWEFVAPGGAL